MQLLDQNMGEPSYSCDKTHCHGYLVYHSGKGYTMVRVWDYGLNTGHTY